jgi:hypothetical protein
VKKGRFLIILLLLISACSFFKKAEKAPPITSKPAIQKEIVVPQKLIAKIPEEIKLLSPEEQKKI